MAVRPLYLLGKDYCNRLPNETENNEEKSSSVVEIPLDAVVIGIARDFYIFIGEQLTCNIGRRSTRIFFSSAKCSMISAHSSSMKSLITPATSNINPAIAIILTR
jgi:hypothetical protein